MWMAIGLPLFGPALTAIGVQGEFEARTEWSVLIGTQNAHGRCHLKAF
jgi:hypothetical protein